MKHVLARILPLALLAVALPADVAGPAQPVLLTLDSGASGGDIGITVTVTSTDSDTQTVTWSGQVATSMSITTAGGFGERADTLLIGNSSIHQSDASYSLDPGVPLTIDFIDWRAVLEGPGGALTGAPVGPHTSTFDLDGAALTFDSGTIDLGVGTMDLSEAPFSFLFGPGDVATAVTVPNGDALDVTVTIPVNSSDTVTESGVTVTVDVACTMVLTGAFMPPPVPMLSANGLLLLVAALAGSSLVAARRLAAQDSRRRARR